MSVEGTEIRTYSEQNNDFISLTDIAKKFSERTDQVILNWLRTRTTVDFLGAWESLHNSNFNPLNFEGIRNQTGAATFVLTISDWIEKTGAIGINAKQGRYGGTFAHQDIAFEFLSYLSPTFKLYVFKEFQRLKGEEAKAQNQALDWSLKRTLSKVNYRIHTDAVKMYLIPPKLVQTKHESIAYASEADRLNLALFGVTARQWQDANPTLKGNIRDYATAEQLLVLANLENLNAHLIKEGVNPTDRLGKLNDIAIYQMELLAGTNLLKSVKELPDNKSDKIED
ncbi:MAG: KilA-N domain-containing protein [Saprospiraceae bacterium]|nr:KilA-N domain-containing protein [Saprospiraceae bacterium]